MSELLLITNPTSKDIDLSTLRIEFYGVSQHQTTGVNIGQHYHLTFIELLNNKGKPIPTQDLVASASSTFRDNVASNALEVTDENHWASGIIDSGQWDRGDTWWQIDGKIEGVSTLRLVWLSYCAPKVRVLVDGQVHRTIEAIRFPNRPYRQVEGWVQLYQYDIVL